ncbi:immunity 21 family protein (plasmid) [Burkholderia sp. FERM BP-3421]|uniref:Imm21 family immunity protein n=1 Tax=Burkholderia sp. FERM BP-3421 TaxID=1494466 RepID=UPI002362E084|nr:Imm21 family immunity protein [Burkholderia sp. FERM BP-3421]WDD90263.1 immunity 21 family protein [Burkholderia sp. FERM BP-3421]
MKWIYSSGGNFIFTGKPVAERWRGNEGLSVMPTAAGGSDYDLACRSLAGPDEYVNVLRNVLGSDVLVVCGAQQEIGFYEISAGSYLLVKIEFGGSEEEIEQCVREVVNGRWASVEDQPFAFAITSPTMVVFDAAFTWEEAAGMGNTVEVVVECGKYAVSLIKYENDNNLLWVVRLSRV